MFRETRKRAGLTKIELAIIVIVVAVIAVVATPNMRRDSTRPLVSRTRSDQRFLATAIEAYFVDYNAFPPMVNLSLYTNDQGREVLKEIGGSSLKALPIAVTTPIAYITSHFPDPMVPNRLKGLTFCYYTDGGGWILIGVGPDGDYDITDPAQVYRWAGRNEKLTTVENYPRLSAFTYDPTNGIVSGGDVWRVKQ